MAWFVSHKSSYRFNFWPFMRQRDQGCTHYTLSGITSFAVLQFATMLFHIAAAAMLTNIAVMDIYSFHELPNNIVDMQLLSDEVKPTKFNIFLNSSTIISNTIYYLVISIVLYIDNDTSLILSTIYKHILLIHYIT